MYIYTRKVIAGQLKITTKKHQKDFQRFFQKFGCIWLAEEYHNADYFR